MGSDTPKGPHSVRTVAFDRIVPHVLRLVMDEVLESEDISGRFFAMTYKGFCGTCKIKLPLEIYS